MRIAVTGATGFVGRQLCPYLQHHLGAEIVAISRTNASNNPMDLSFTQTDEQLATRLSGRIDCLIHLAAKAHNHKASATDFARDNVVLSERVARLCISSNIPRMILLSSIKVNGESTAHRPPYSAADIPAPEDNYGRSKLASEQVVQKIFQNSTTEWVIVRPPLIYGENNKGNLQSLLKLMCKGIPLPFNNIHNRRDLVSIENLCSVISLAITHPQAAGEIFLVSDGVARNTKEIAQLIAERAGLNPYFFATPQWLLKLLAYVKPQIIKRLTEDLAIDITKTQALLGWKPLIK